MIDFSNITTISDADVMIGRLEILHDKYFNRKGSLLAQLSSAQSNSTNYQSRVEELQENISALTIIASQNGSTPDLESRKILFQGELDKLQQNAAQLQLDGYQAKLESLALLQGAIETYEAYQSELLTHKSTLTA